MVFAVKIVELEGILVLKGLDIKSLHFNLIGVVVGTLLVVKYLVGFVKEHVCDLAALDDRESAVLVHGLQVDDIDALVN